MILTPDEERILLAEAHEWYARAIEAQEQANLIFDKVRASQYARMDGIRQGEGDGG